MSSPAKSPAKFVVTIPVKPYVKRFVELNYGLPADFTQDDEIIKLVRRCLKNPNTRFDNMYDYLLRTHTDTLEIVISQDEFYRHGWEFSKTDIVMFGKRFETPIKKKMRGIVSFYVGLGYSKKDAIIKYQEKNLMEEYFWPYESIKKDYYRKRPTEKIDFFDDIIDKIEELFMVKVSRKKDTFTLQNYTRETA
jgi:hypothetical protein